MTGATVVLLASWCVPSMHSISMGGWWKWTMPRAPCAITAFQAVQLMRFPWSCCRDCCGRRWPGGRYRSSILLDQGHDVMLTTAHAEFGFPHGGCGLWDTFMINWPLQTLEEAVAAQDGSHITCRSQWLVKRLVHLFTAAGGRTSTRVRLQQLEGEWHATGTGTVPLADVHTSFSPIRT